MVDGAFSRASALLRLGIAMGLADRTFHACMADRKLGIMGALLRCCCTRWPQVLSIGR